MLPKYGRYHLTWDKRLMSDLDEKKSNLEHGLTRPRIPSTPTSSINSGRVVGSQHILRSTDLNTFYGDLSYHSRHFREVIPKTFFALQIQHQYLFTGMRIGDIKPRWLHGNRLRESNQAPISQPYFIHNYIEGLGFPAFLLQGTKT